MTAPLGLRAHGDLWLREVERPAALPWRPLRPHPALAPLADGDAGTVVALDLETTGLHGAGVMAFLIGLAVPVAPGLVVVRQWVLPDPAAEAQLLDRLEREFAALPPPVRLVTFNGDQFDLPFLRTRARMNRLRLSLPGGLDLLPLARRLYRMQAGACRLAHLERVRLGVAREDDLPGYLVPAVYLEFLRRREVEVLEPVLRHNAVDLVSTLGLVQAVAEDLAADVATALPPAVAFGRARVAEALGDPDGTEAALRAAVVTQAPPEVRRRATDRLLALFRRQGRWQEAEQFLEGLCAAPWPSPDHLVAWAKILEHRRRDFATALGVTERALERVEREGRLLRRPPPADTVAALEHRARRLRRRLGERQAG
jgi:uncharacterized protein YprB with RNaseH-like and TPR domain